MDPQHVFQEFHAFVRAPAPLNLDDAVREVEALYPDALKVFQKDVSVFEGRTLFGVPAPEAYAGAENKDDFWKHVMTCAVASLFHGDIKQKIGSVFQIAKSAWTASGQSSDEVDRILNDDNTTGHLEELLEYVTNLRSAKVLLNVLENIDVEALDIPLDDPVKLVEMVRDPQHPTMQRCIATVQRAVQQKLERGELTQHQLQSDIEGIKAKVQSLFGSMFTEALGGRRADVPSTVLMSNSPEARRQRMLARLQRKQQEKTKR